MIAVTPPTKPRRAGLFPEAMMKADSVSVKNSAGKASEKQDAARCSRDARIEKSFSKTNSYFTQSVVVVCVAKIELHQGGDPNGKTKTIR